MASTRSPQIKSSMLDILEGRRQVQSLNINVVEEEELPESNAVEGHICRPTPYTDKNDQETWSSLPADSVHSLLVSILREQASLRVVFQKHQDVICRKLDDLPISITSQDEKIQVAVSPQTEEAKQNKGIQEVGDLEEEARKWFRKIDTDHSGSINRSELKALLTNWTMSTRPLFRDRLNLKSEADIDRFIASVDLNGSGEIDENEFVLFVNRQRLEYESPAEKRDVTFLRMHHKVPMLRRTLEGRVFELVIAFILIVNIFFLWAGLQSNGLHEGWKLGLRHDDSKWSEQESFFAQVEFMFNTFFLIELLVRIWAYGWKFHKQFSNLLDTVVVLISFLDSIIHVVNVSVLRLVRVTRYFRLFKAMRFSKEVFELRVLVRTVTNSYKGVFWAMVLLGCVILTGALIMAQMVIAIIAKEEIDFDQRVWLYTYFGTAAKALFTMFECTFSGHWWYFFRPLIEETHYSFALFWIFWVVMVNFALMRIVGAFFLRETMERASADAEKCAMVQLKRKGELSERLRLMFKNADTSGDGAISSEEFEFMMTHPSVVEEFHRMGLDIDEVNAFFAVLTSDDDRADYNEFITGALAMASSAPSLDRLKSLQNQMKIQNDLQDIMLSIEQLKRGVPILDAKK